MKAVLILLLVTGVLSGCMTTTYIDPRGIQTQVVQPAPGVVEAMALGFLAGAVVAMDRSTTPRYYSRPRYYRRY
jgi:hypothetical protein